MPAGRATWGEAIMDQAELCVVAVWASLGVAAVLGIGPNRAVAILDVFQSVILDQLDAARERWRIAEQHLCTVGERQPNGSYRCGSDTGAFDTACRALQAAIDEAPLSVLISFSAAQARISGLQETEWDALECLCGMSVDAQRSMSSPIEVKARPWFFFPGRRLTLFDLSASYDALFAAFDKVARDTVAQAPPLRRHRRRRPDISGSC